MRIWLYELDNIKGINYNLVKIIYMQIERFEEGREMAS